MNVWDLKRGDRFRVDGADCVFVFDHMDGMYCFARDPNGNPFSWNGPVEKVEDEPCAE